MLKTIPVYKLLSYFTIFLSSIIWTLCVFFRTFGAENLILSMPMELYAIYSFELSESVTINGMLPNPDEISVSESEYYQCFERIFAEQRGGEVKIQKVKGSTATKYPCQVMYHRDNVIILRLEREKNVPLWEKTETGNPVAIINRNKRPSTPFCYVVIDNRSEYRKMAIQINREAWKDTNQVKDLLHESFNDLLHIAGYRIDVTIKTMMQTTKFWDYVNRRRKIDKVDIKSLTFTFYNHRRRPGFEIESVLSSKWNHYTSFMDMIDRWGGDEGEITLNASKSGALLRSKSADVKHLIELCVSSEYGLRVTFTDNITYNCNQNMRAEYPLDDKLNFDIVDKDLGDLFGNKTLLMWLNKIKLFCTSYENIEEIKPKAGREDKRRAS